MAAELRWILLGLSLLLLAGIWWWGSRRSAQAPGNAELREITPAPEPRVTEEPPVREDPSCPRMGVAIRALKHQNRRVRPGSGIGRAHDGQRRSCAVRHAVHHGEHHAKFSCAERRCCRPACRRSCLRRANEAVAPAQNPNSSESQKIVTVRVCAAGEARWSGATLLSALELNGLAYGRYQVFHRKHVDGRSLFCVASLVEPGTFDVARMSTEEFKGVTLFAVLPGPIEPLLTIDELLAAARGLAHELSGMVQDAKGMPMSPQRVAALRDDVARFQASLPRA